MNSTEFTHRNLLEERAAWAVGVAQYYFGTNESTARFAAELMRQLGLLEPGPYRQPKEPQ